MWMLWMALSAAEAGRVDPMAYNDAWVTLHDQAVVAYRTAELTALSGGDSDAAREAGLAKVEELRATAEELPAYPPGQELAAAFSASLDGIEESLDTGWIRVDELLAQDKPRDHHQLELEALLNRMEAQALANNARVDAAQQAYMSAHNATLIGPPVPLEPAPEMVVDPPLPGAASTLDTHLRIDFALRHYAEVHQVNNHVASAWDRAVSGDHSSRARLEELQAQIHDTPAWMGDGQLRDAVQGALDLMVELASTALPEVERLSGPLLVLPWRLARHRTLTEDMNAAIDAAEGAVVQGSDSFREQWHFDELRTFNQELRDWARMQHAR